VDTIPWAAGYNDSTLSSRTTSRRPITERPITFRSIDGSLIEVIGFTEFSANYARCRIDGKGATRPVGLLPPDAQARLHREHEFISPPRGKVTKLPAQKAPTKKQDTRAKVGQPSGKTADEKKGKDEVSTVGILGVEYPLVDYSGADLMDRMSQAWLDANVPGMDDGRFGQLVSRLMASGWSAGGKGTIAVRVIPLRGKK
jgi:hypothetical protein